MTGDVVPSISPRKVCACVSLPLRQTNTHMQQIQSRTQPCAVRIYVIGSGGSTGPLTTCKGHIGSPKLAAIAHKNVNRNHLFYQTCKRDIRDRSVGSTNGDLFHVHSHRQRPPSMRCESTETFREWWSLVAALTQTSLRGGCRSESIRSDREYEHPHDTVRRPRMIYGLITTTLIASDQGIRQPVLPRISIRGLQGSS